MTITAPHSVALSPSPFIHVGEDRVYNPLTDATLAEGEAGYAVLRALLAGHGDAAVTAAGDAALPALEKGGWLAATGEDVSTRFRLKYVSLEGQTGCNQKCYFCPVSVAPRQDYTMPTAMYERIVGELAAWRDTIEAVFMIAYNEPTADKRFVEQVRTIRAAGLPPAVLTNATGLTPARVDAVIEMGGLRFLSVNLSTLDRERYRETRGGDHLPLVLRNVDYLASLPLAEQMDMVVLGTGDENHRRDFDEIRARYAGSRFTVKYFVVMDRAGYLEVGSTQPPIARLQGCENVGSRPLQHLHITPRGACVLCCEDYDEKYVVGDLNRSSVAEVLAGPEIARLRRWAYGIEEAPADFICRRCVFARGA